MELNLSEITFNKHELQNPKYKKYLTTLADGTVTVELNYETKNKADFSISVDGNAIGVSSKAIDLSKTGFTDKHGQFVPASISLQSGTNLLTYLLKAQQIQDKVGTHFLNVYATDDSSVIDAAN
jgi:hypothetical protein